MFERIFSALASAWPNAHCELNYNNHFQLLIAVMLSAQTTDKAVNKALLPLWQKQPNFSAQDLVHMGEVSFLKIIRSIGLAPTKAKNSVAAARILTGQHKGIVPLNRKDLEALPGVGRKTASVVLNVLCQLPTMPVDTHVERVSIRMGLVQPTQNRLKIEHELLEKIPQKYIQNAHHLLIFQGRYQCTAKKPQCHTCVVNDICPKIGLKNDHK